MTYAGKWHDTLNHHWLRTFHIGLEATWILCLSTLLQGVWFSDEMQYLLLSEKRTFEHWVMVQFFFSLAKVWGLCYFLRFNSMYLPNPSGLAGCHTRSICMWSLTGLNSELFFSKTSCNTNVKEPCLPHY